MPNANECLSDELTCRKLQAEDDIEYVICTDDACRPCLKITEVHGGGTSTIKSKNLSIPIVEMLKQFANDPIPSTELEISGSNDNDDRGWVVAILVDMRLVVEENRGRYRLTAVGRQLLEDEALIATLEGALAERRARQ